jgi:hypothetical protein
MCPLDQRLAHIASDVLTCRSFGFPSLHDTLRRLVGDMNAVRSAAMNCGAARNAQIVARVIAEDAEIRANGMYFTIVPYPSFHP